jgi:hypothetical protein
VDTGTYYYRITAYNSGGAGPESDTREVAVEAMEETGLVAATSAAFAAALSAIQNSGEDHFIITVGADFSSAPISLTDAAYNGKTITLRGSGGSHEISLAGQGSLFTVGAADSEPVFILRDITLKGITDNTATLLKLNNGELIMESGAIITGNTAPISGSGIFGGGVYVAGGTFAMRDNASINGNTAVFGGGVAVWGGNFTMHDSASISENTMHTTAGGHGGGVFVRDGTFAMRDNASISGNTAIFFGGGVYISGGSSFTMQNNASVSGNTTIFPFPEDNEVTTSGGGGVFVASGSGSFTMRDNASVSGNTAYSARETAYGGGVYISGGSSFTMQGTASVSGNTVSSASGTAHGGGVYVHSNGTFDKTGGIIYGSNETGNDTDGNPLKNTAQHGGAAVYKDGSPARSRNNTAGTSVNFDTSTDSDWWE